MPSTALTAEIKQKALEIGFSDVGIATPQLLVKESFALRSIIENKYHASLSYLERNIDIREDIRNLMPDAKSVIITLSSYIPQFQQPMNTYKISYYTYANDYHYIIKEKLNLLLAFLKEKVSTAQGEIFVDTKPVFEKAYATLAGLGWVGRNTLLIHPVLGSFVFIGGIVTNIELNSDQPNTSSCPPNCNLCVEACPTKALEKPYVLNASKCISYATIENKDEQPPFDNPTLYIAGCDICQLVCPYNKNVTKQQNTWFKANEYVHWNKEQWANLRPADFKRTFKHTVFKRIGYKYLMRNVRWVNGNNSMTNE